MSLRAVFMGSPEIAVPSLHAVRRVCDLRLVVTQPDRPAGRGKKLTPPAVKLAAESLSLPVSQPSKMKDGTVAAALRELEIDVIVVVAFGRILPPDILAIPEVGCINVHFSLLPRWRGAAPVQRAILAGDAETGVSIMRMDAGLDTGPVYRRVSTPIEPTETAGELSDRLAALGADTLERFFESFPGLEPVPQDDQAVTLAPPLHKREGETHWNRHSAALVNHIRGMDPWPVAHTMRGSERLRLFDARPGPEGASGSVPGQVLRVDEQGMHVATADGSVVVARVQPAGRRRMAARDYAAGKPFAPTERLGQD